jgi:hypothetical protein
MGRNHKRRGIDKGNQEGGEQIEEGKKTLQTTTN